MRKKVFWIGAVVLVVGVILFGYGSLTVQNLFERMRELFTRARFIEVALSSGMSVSPVQILEEPLFLVQLLQLMGLGMAVLGSILSAYGLWVKKES